MMWSLGTRMVRWWKPVSSSRWMLITQRLLTSDSERINLKTVRIILLSFLQEKYAWRATRHALTRKSLSNTRDMVLRLLRTLPYRPKMEVQWVSLTCWPVRWYSLSIPRWLFLPMQRDICIRWEKMLLWLSWTFLQEKQQRHTSRWCCILRLHNIYIKVIHIRWFCPPMLSPTSAVALRTRSAAWLTRAYMSVHTKVTTPTSSRRTLNWRSEAWCSLTVTTKLRLLLLRNMDLQRASVGHGLLMTTIPTSAPCRTRNMCPMVSRMTGWLRHSWR